MRKKIIAGNWKMNGVKQDAQALTAEILAMMKDEVSHEHHVILSPPFPFLGMLVQQTASESRIYIAAQNCSDKNSGAFTGEVSASMISSVGVQFIIIGHSERRTYYGDTDDIIGEKVKRALENNCRPVFCCGEKLEERESGNHFKTVQSQIEKGLFHLDDAQFQKTVIAYEPVWAIGSGRTATAEQAQEMHAFIRSLVKEKYAVEMAENTSILYGGSCNEKNAPELFNLPDVDGGLIGGASLKSRSFIDIVKSMK